MELNSKQYDAQHKQLLFDAVIDILKLKDVVYNPFQVRVFHAWYIRVSRTLCRETFMGKSVVKT